MTLVSTLSILRHLPFLVLAKSLPTGHRALEPAEQEALATKTSRRANESLMLCHLFSCQEKKTRLVSSHDGADTDDDCCTLR